MCILNEQVISCLEPGRDISLLPIHHRRRIIADSTPLPQHWPTHLRDKSTQAQDYHQPTRSEDNTGVVIIHPDRCRLLFCVHILDQL